MGQRVSRCFHRWIGSLQRVQTLWSPCILLMWLPSRLFRADPVNGSVEKDGEEQVSHDVFLITEGMMMGMKILTVSGDVRVWSGQDGNRTW